MDQSNQTVKKMCIGLGALVLILLLAIAFLLGKQTAAKKTDGAGRNTSEIAVTGVTALPGASEEDSGNAAGPAEDTTAGSAVNTTAAEKDAAPSAAPTVPPTASVPADTPRTLQVEMSNGSLTFTAGAAFDVAYDPGVIRVEKLGDGVTIRNDHSNPSASERKRMDVVVTVPAGYAFEDVELEMGAGKLTAQTLRTKTLRLEMGAGSATLDGLYVTGSADVQNGAGAFAIKGGAINDLTLQCGAGATQVKAALTGSSRIMAAVGAVDLQFDGKESDYTVAFQMSLGACYYNNTKISRSGTFGSGPNRVDITGGFGVMRVTVG